MLATLFAQDPAPATEKAAPQGMGSMIFPFAVMMIAMFCFMILPARRQRKEQEAMIAALKSGTKIVTGSGIIGTIVTIKDGEDELVIRSADTKLKITRASVARVLGQDDAETK